MNIVIERSIFMLAGAFIITTAYMFGSYQYDVKAQNEAETTFETLIVKQGIILGDVSDKGSPIATMFVNKSKEMAAIMLGKSDGTGSIDLDKQLI